MIFSFTTYRNLLFFSSCLQLPLQHPFNNVLGLPFCPLYMSKPSSQKCLTLAVCSAHLSLPVRPRRSQIFNFRKRHPAVDKLCILGSFSILILFQIKSSQGKCVDSRLDQWVDDRHGGSVVII